MGKDDMQKAKEEMERSKEEMERAKEEMEQSKKEMLRAKEEIKHGEVSAMDDEEDGDEEDCSDEDFEDERGSTRIRQGKIENNGISVLKDLTEEDIKNIRFVENNGVMIVPQKLIAKLSVRGLENNGVLIPYVEGMRLYAGHTKFDSEVLEALDGPIDMIQAGLLVFSKDVAPEQVKAKIGSIRNYGKIVAPENVYGVVVAKCIENTGSISRNGNRHSRDDDDCDDECSGHGHGHH